MNKVISRALLVSGIAVGIGFCGLLVKTGSLLAKGVMNDNRFFVAMVTDGGGINDQSFQESSWKGLKAFSEETGSRVGYVECQQASDYPINLDKLADENADLVWGIGYKLADPIKLAANINPEINYAIADFSFGSRTPDNVTCAIFRSEESSFLVGYIAAMTTKVNRVGFIGGMKSVVIDQFEYGYRAGVAYASKKLGKNIDVKIQYAESFTDSAKGKAIAIKMFDECDVIFHAAGGAGVGIIEAAKEKGSYAIGCDMDQSSLAPKNVLTSSIKDVGKAVKTVSTSLKNGEKIGGKTFSYGIKENCVGIPKENPNVPENVKNAVKAVEEKVRSGEIIPPGTSASYEEFIKLLPNLKV